MATSLSYGKNGNYDPPVKSEPLNRMTCNLPGLILRQREKRLCQIWWKSVHGDLWANGWLFYLFIFSRTCTEQTPGWILMHNVSKDAESCKDAPLWVKIW